jgi:putative membrane protein
MDMGIIFSLLLATILGMLFTVPLAFIPSLHAYNVLGFAILFRFSSVYTWFANGLEGMGIIVDDLFMVMFTLGLVQGYSMLNTIQGTYLGVPDDSTLFTILPSQKYLMQGRAHEGVVITGLGSLIGTFYLCCITPFLIPVFRWMRVLITPHQFWIIGLVVAFYIMSEWPKDFGVGHTRWQRLWDGWSTLFAGMLTFFLASILGFITFYKTVIPLERAYQGLMPAIVGLFAAPALITNLLADIKIPKQFACKSVELYPSEVLHATGAGLLGGMLGAFIPAITAGPAGLLAGHATASQGDKVFIMSFGVNKIVYYTGAVVLWFLPGLNKGKGGAKIMLNLFFAPQTFSDFIYCAGAVMVAGVLSFFLLVYFSSIMGTVLQKLDYKVISIIASFLVVIIVIVMTSWQGLIIFIVSTAVGLIPVMFFARRGNGLAIILTPIALGMAGQGPRVAGWLGLL